MCVYFFDILGLSYLIAPDYNREFGVLENIQLLIIAAVVIVSYKSMKKATTNWLRLFFILICFGSVLVLLEEIDYGLHYYDYLIGKSEEQIRIESWDKSTIRNIHNQGKLTHYIKLIAYLSMAVIILAPIVLRRLNLRNRVIEFLAPHHHLLYTLLSMIVLNQLALYADKNLKSAEINALKSNVSEFEEVFIYWIVFLYVVELSKQLLSK